MKIKEKINFISNKSHFQILIMIIFNRSLIKNVVTYKLNIIIT